MKIAIGSDHAGFELKESVKKLLEEKGYEYDDLGAETLDQKDDYPEFGRRVGEAVSSGKYQRGIIVCGTGIGIAISANKVPGIRAAACYNPDMAEISRSHNDANILVLGGRVVGDILALEILRTWLETPFEGGRHQRRLDLFDDIQRFGK